MWLDGFEPPALCTSSRCTKPLYDNHIAVIRGIEPLSSAGHALQPLLYVPLSEYTNTPCYHYTISPYISINSVPGRRLERPIFALGERCISIMLPRRVFIPSCAISCWNQNIHFFHLVHFYSCFRSFQSNYDNSDIITVNFLHCYFCSYHLYDEPVTELCQCIRFFLPIHTFHTYNHVFPACIF